MIYEIKHRFSGAVLFALECDSLKLCVEAAVKSRVNLSWANLAGADLAEADLTGADLSAADLTGAKLNGAHLSWANLSGAGLSGADLIGADLRWANLTKAELNGANLSEANLCGVNLTKAELYGAKWWTGVILRATPIQLNNLPWLVTILDEHMEIGFETHTFAEWGAFDEGRIASMDLGPGDKLPPWRKYKDVLLALCATRTRVEHKEAA